MTHYHVTRGTVGDAPDQSLRFDTLTGAQAQVQAQSLAHSYVQGNEHEMDQMLDGMTTAFCRADGCLFVVELEECGGCNG